jgi:hypothetical protein
MYIFKKYLDLLHIYEEIHVNTKNEQIGLCGGIFLLHMISSCGFEPKRKSVLSRLKKCL